MHVTDDPARPPALPPSLPPAFLSPLDVFRLDLNPQNPDPHRTSENSCQISLLLLLLLHQRGEGGRRRMGRRGGDVYFGLVGLTPAAAQSHDYLL